MSDLLNCHVSTVAQNGQSKHWLQRGPFVFLAATSGSNHATSVHATTSYAVDLEMQKVRTSSTTLICGWTTEQPFSWGIVTSWTLIVNVPIRLGISWSSLQPLPVSRSVSSGSRIPEPLQRLSPVILAPTGWRIRKAQGRISSVLLVQALTLHPHTDQQQHCQPKAAFLLQFFHLFCLLVSYG